MHSQLAAITRDVRDAQTRLERLLATTPADRWLPRAEPGSWSVAECIAHLNLTSAAMVPPLRAACDEARVLGGGAPRRFKRTALGLVISSTGGPRWRIGGFRLGRVSTAPAFVPGGDLPQEQVVREFTEWTASELDLLEEADGLPLDRVRMESPFVKGAMYDAYSGMLTLGRHKHRHLEQAERVWGSQ